MALISSRYAYDGITPCNLDDIQKEYIKKYIDKCNSGEYRTVEYACECGSTDFETIGERDRYGLPVKTVICKKCGLIMTNPRLADECNASFYDNEYHYIYRAESKPSEKAFLDRKENAKYIVNFVEKHCELTGKKMLEIGCADGGNVAAFAEAGYDTHGIDLSSVYTNFGKEHGLDLHCCSAGGFAKETDEKFDLIVLNHVLEHFTDIKGELANISKLLSDDGILFVALPGIKYLSFNAYDAQFLGMLQSAHVWNFTKDTLCQVMKKYGYEAIHCNELIRGVFKKCEPVGNFENFYSEIRTYLDKVEGLDGDFYPLLFERIESILAGYSNGEVLLYGSSDELNVLVNSITSTESIRGFITIENKSPYDVASYILEQKETNPVKALVLVCANCDEEACDRLYAVEQVGTKLYSFYNDYM